jgi:hypothetical protein
MTIFEHAQQHYEMGRISDMVYGSLNNSVRTNYSCYADRPSATSFGVGEALVCGKPWYSDGTRWYYTGGRLPLLVSGIPMIVPTSGTIGNNGALSGITALPVTYSSCYMYFPADAIRATVAEAPGPPVVPAVPGTSAGWYYVVMSSTTAGSIKNNVYTSGVPIIPSSLTAFVTTGPGAFTQTTSEITALSFTVPANILGDTGALRFVVRGENSASADDKTYKVTFGGSTVIGGVVNTTATSLLVDSEIFNISANKQSIYNSTAYGATTGHITYLTKDTTADVTVTITVQLEAATDFVMISGALFEVIPN